MMIYESNINVLMLIVYMLLQIICGGLIFNGVKKLYKMVKHKELLQQTKRTPFYLFIIGLIGLMYYYVSHTLDLIDSFN